MTKFANRVVPHRSFTYVFSLQYPGQPFKVPTMSRWIVVLNGTQHVEDVRKASDDVLSFQKAIAEVC